MVGMGRAWTEENVETLKERHHVVSTARPQVDILEEKSS